MSSLFVNLIKRVSERKTSLRNALRPPSARTLT